MTQKTEAHAGKTETPAAEAEAQHLKGDNLSEGEFLSTLGKRVREIRERRGMTRKLVARDADVSERYLSQLEAGEGNISIILLRRIAAALDVSLIEILAPEAEDTVEKRLIRRFLERLPQSRLEEVVFRLMRDFGHDEAVRRKRIALVGLRGAGKTTLGQRLAKELTMPFVELDREIEKDTGMPVSEIFALYGQAGYRRTERRCLERAIRDNERAVISVGGGIVSQLETYDFLLSNCYTIWLKASPEEHMSRVVAQGDLRPMAGNDEAMDDLKRILEARDALYRRADTVLDTSNEAVDASFVKLRRTVGG